MPLVSRMCFLYRAYSLYVISIECGPHGQVLACLVRRVLACLIARGRHSLLGRGICVLLILKQYKHWLKNDVRLWLSYGDRDKLDTRGMEVRV